VLVSCHALTSDDWLRIYKDSVAVLQRVFSKIIGFWVRVAVLHRNQNASVLGALQTQDDVLGRHDDSLLDEAEDESRDAHAVK
jgi:hypothetical protein